jgi:mono/diheme cytochrome c family protein
MRTRAALLAVLGALVLAVAGCGGEETAPLPEEVEGPVPTEADEPAAPPEEPVEPGEAEPEAGAQVFADAGCGTCHAYARAGSTATIAPDFDEVETDFDEAVDVIANGRGAMPAFGDQLTDQQIRDVAAFIADD